ncbi:hypothetical protein ACJX0J_024156, partial [Zea mays]
MQTVESDVVELLAQIGWTLSIYFMLNRIVVIEIFEANFTELPVLSLFAYLQSFTSSIFYVNFCEQKVHAIYNARYGKEMRGYIKSQLHILAMEKNYELYNRFFLPIDGFKGIIHMISSAARNASALTGIMPSFRLKKTHTNSSIINIRKKLCHIHNAERE